MAYQLRNPADASWTQDLLGPDYGRRELPLSDSNSATLIRHRPRHRSFSQRLLPPLRGIAVLYVHGWSDYFFQTELAEFLTSAGADFYAVDLRRYGRSLKPDSTPGFITDLADYAEEFDAAHRIITSAHPGTRFVLLGHSTGGLSAALYAAANPGKVDALALNSPWLEFQATELGRTALSKLLAASSHFNPRRTLPSVDPGLYTRTVSNQFEGEWDYDLSWRPVNGFKVTTGFLNAVFNAQARVKKGLELDMPVLALLSSHNYLLPRWHDSATSSDVALNVQAVAHRCIDLGRDLHLHRLPGALHDVFLSAPPVRAQAYMQLGSWLAELKHRQHDSQLATVIKRILPEE